MWTERLAFVSILAVGLAVTACTRGSDKLSAAAGQTSGDTAAAGAAECPPLETRSPSASGQQPAFPGQTRACGIKSNVGFEVVVLTRQLEHPWAVEPLPDGNLLVTEKPGRMRVVSATGQVGQPIAGVPEVDARGQGGLLDVVLSPGFASDRTIFWSYSEPRQGGNATSVARGVLSRDNRRLEQVKVIVRALPTYDGDKHYGSRLMFDQDGMLFITLGERSDKPMRPQAQQLNSHMGKILRVTPDGAAPKDNPFVGKSGALPEIWSLGHRNIQAAAFDPQGQLWEVEHGTNGGDELNRVEKNKNYGWPIVAYGEEYAGTAISGAVTSREGYEQPVYYWDPVIAPSGMQFYTGNAFPEWKGSLFIGALREMRLVRLQLENNRVTGEEHLLVDRRQRVRDVRQDAQGALYLVTDQDNGELWKITPRR
jgi:glucose/arabinose dehydrogenase